MSEGLYSTEVKDYDTNLDLTKLKPYGDINDGKVRARLWCSALDQENMQMM